MIHFFKELLRIILTIYKKSASSHFLIPFFFILRAFINSFNIVSVRYDYNYTNSGLNALFFKWSNVNDGVSWQRRGSTSTLRYIYICDPAKRTDGSYIGIITFACECNSPSYRERIIHPTEWISIQYRHSVRLSCRTSFHRCRSRSINIMSVHIYYFDTW